MEEDFDSSEEEERTNQLTKVAEHMFENGVWSNSKEQMKDMSKRDSSKHMFILGFLMSAQYINEELKEITKELEEMSREDIQEMVEDFKEEWGENENK